MFQPALGNKTTDMHAVIGAQQLKKFSQPATQAVEPESGEVPTEQPPSELLDIAKSNGPPKKYQPMQLVFKIAIEAINAELALVMGANAIETSVESSNDISPETLADGLLGIIKIFFPYFQEAHESLDVEEQLEHYLELVDSGVEQGLEEAKNILYSDNLLDGEIASVIDESYERIQEELEYFREDFFFDEE